MFKAGMHKIVFSIEPADWSVGITTEDFSAWVEDAYCWCQLTDIAEKIFAWYDNEGNELEIVSMPSYYKSLETLLLAYAESFYARDY